MKITVYCLKGSAGKTPIAVNIALDKGYAVATNEPFNVLDTFIPEERLITIEAGEQFPQFPNNIDVVFDLAGTLSREASPSIVSAVAQSHVVLVPIYDEVKCHHAGVETLREVAAINKNIVVVATKLEREKKEDFFTDWRDSNQFQRITRVVREGAKMDVPIFPLKKSAVFDTIFEREKSIAQLMESDALLRYAYRDVSAQFDELFNFVERTYAVKK